MPQRCLLASTAGGHHSARHAPSPTVLASVARGHRSGAAVLGSDDCQRNLASYVRICDANADAAVGVPCIFARLLSMPHFKSDRIPVDFGL